MACFHPTNCSRLMLSCKVSLPRPNLSMPFCCYVFSGGILYLYKEPLGYLPLRCGWILSLLFSELDQLETDIFLPSRAAHPRLRSTSSGQLSEPLMAAFSTLLPNLPISTPHACDVTTSASLVSFGSACEQLYCSF